MADRPIPLVTVDNQPHWDGAARGELVIQRCTACDVWLEPGFENCPRCASSALEWRTASGAGVLHTFNVYHRPYHPWWAERLPYNTAVIELAEGPLMLSQVVNCPLNELACGMSLRVTFEAIEEGITLPKWEPA